MAKFRKKPVVIEAMQYRRGGENDAIYADWPDWAKAVLVHNVDGLIFSRAGRHGLTIEAFPTHLVVHTLEGAMRAEPGDWIIRGVNGEIYPCKPDIFAKTYEPVDEQENNPRERSGTAREAPGT